VTTRRGSRPGPRRRRSRQAGRPGVPRARDLAGQRASILVPHDRRHNGQLRASVGCAAVLLAALIAVFRRLTLLVALTLIPDIRGLVSVSLRCSDLQDGLQGQARLGGPAIQVLHRSCRATHIAEPGAGGPDPFPAVRGLGGCSDLG
jgi:hypothetical protein